MISVSISEFGANMNGILQTVQQGEIVMLTRRGAKIARLAPPDFAREAARQEFEAILALDINHLDAQIHLAAIDPNAEIDPTLLPVR